MQSLAPDQLQHILLGQTARIPFSQLQPNFAKGQVLWLAPELDLLTVAEAMIQDDVSRIQQWQQAEQFHLLADEQAQQWLADTAEVWALVVTPWVLVQALPQTEAE